MLALAGGDWGLILSALQLPALIGTIYVGRSALQRLRIEGRRVDSDETLAASRMMSDANEVLHREVVDLRLRIEQCEERWREHTVVCPTYRGSGYDKRT